MARRGKVQQAVFELRKVASKIPPDLEAAQALGMVALVYRQQGNPKEADRARGEQLKLLEKLTKSGRGDEPAFAHYLLGMEHKHDGRRPQAKAHLEAALAAGTLPSEETRRVRVALQGL
jgi:tetratricopeptide (TPR) repeat protein